MDSAQIEVVTDAMEQVRIQSMESYIQSWQVTTDGMAWREVAVIRPHRVFYQVQQLMKEDDLYRAVGKPTQDFDKAMASAQTRATRSGQNHRIIEFVAKAPSPSEDTTDEETAT